jgi:hypothetical protein
LLCDERGIKSRVDKMPEEVGVNQLRLNACERPVKDYYCDGLMS